MSPMLRCNGGGDNDICDDDCRGAATEAAADVDNSRREGAER